MTSGPASHVKPVTKQTFGRASLGAAREAAGEALPNGASQGEEWRKKKNGCVVVPINSVSYASAAGSLSSLGD